jgi:phosphoglycolate phosphatase
MNLKDHLFLFDIDGTILDIKGDGKTALIIAIEESLGIKITEEINMQGGIDSVFFKNYFNICGLPRSQYGTCWENFKDKYISEMNRFDGKNWHIFPNAFETIKYLRLNSNIGLATGNIKSGSFIKLNHFNLDGFFTAGGFGDDAETRSWIVSEAVSSAESVYGKKFDRNKIFLFGDTHKDMKSAVDNGIIPVLIDPDKKNRADAASWNAKYYGSFFYFDRFLDSLSEADTDIVYFDRQ